MHAHKEVLSPIITDGVVRVVWCLPQFHACHNFKGMLSGGRQVFAGDGGRAGWPWMRGQEEHSASPALVLFSGKLCNDWSEVLHLR